MLQVWRDLFSYACLVAALVHLQQLDPSLHKASALIMSEGGTGTEAASSNNPKADSPQKAVATAMHELDMAAIMGGPLFRAEIDSLICAVQSLHQQRLDTSVARTSVKRRFDDISSSDRPDSCCEQRKASVHRSQTKQQSSDNLPGKVSIAKFAHHGDSGNAAQQQVQQLAAGSAAGRSHSTASSWLSPATLRQGDNGAAALHGKVRVQIAAGIHLAHEH